MSVSAAWAGKDAGRGGGTPVVPLLKPRLKSPPLAGVRAASAARPDAPQKHRSIKA